MELDDDIFDVSFREGNAQRAGVAICCGNWSCRSCSDCCSKSECSAAVKSTVHPHRNHAVLAGRRDDGGLDHESVGKERRNHRPHGRSSSQRCDHRGTTHQAPSTPCVHYQYAKRWQECEISDNLKMHPLRNAPVRSRWFGTQPMQAGSSMDDLGTPVWQGVGGYVSCLPRHAWNEAPSHLFCSPCSSDHLLCNRSQVLSIFTISRRACLFAPATYLPEASFEEAAHRIHRGWSGAAASLTSVDGRLTINT